jgi:hypothetical protein
MTDWYIGRAGRWISMTFYKRIVSLERVNMKGSVEQCLFKVNLLVGHPSVTDEVDDPIFAFIWGKVQVGREVTFGKIKGGLFSFSIPYR